jgi:hypothetical protein
MAILMLKMLPHPTAKTRNTQKEAEKLRKSLIPGTQSLTYDNVVDLRTRGLMILNIYFTRH